mgnify:CR=1 FL=1
MCRQHLLGEHRELHGLWNILAKHGGVGGYSRHPETRRWVGKLAALYTRHEALVVEITRRGYRHESDLDGEAATGSLVQDAFIERRPDSWRSCRASPAHVWLQIVQQWAQEPLDRVRQICGGRAAAHRHAVDHDDHVDLELIWCR